MRRRARKRRSLVETVLENALQSVARTVTRAARGIARVLPLKPAGRPKPHHRRGPAPPAGRRRRAAHAGVRVQPAMEPRDQAILDPAARAFLADLHRRFEAPRRALIEARAVQQERYDAGERPDFSAATRDLREGDWTVAAASEATPPRIELLVPPHPASLQEARRSGADACIADFDDALVPAWTQVLAGQHGLRHWWTEAESDAHGAPMAETGLAPRAPILALRPRGWHLVETHVSVDRQPMAAALFDVGLAVFHNSAAARARRGPPCVHLAKLESQAEARLWTDVLAFAEQALALPPGCIKVSVAIDTLPAAFEVEEIVWALRERIVALAVGRWDYVFSFVKTLARDPTCLLPQRSELGQSEDFLAGLAAHVLATGCRRGVPVVAPVFTHCLSPRDAAAQAGVLAQLREEVQARLAAGFQRVRLRHSDLVPVIRSMLSEAAVGTLAIPADPASVTRAALLRVPAGRRTEAAFRAEVRTTLGYFAAWLGGQGVLAHDGAVHDAATAECGRALLWQWLRHQAPLDGGGRATVGLLDDALAQAARHIAGDAAIPPVARSRVEQARDLLRALVLASEFEDFFTARAAALLD